MVANLTHFTETRNWTSHSYNQVVPIEPGGVVLVARAGVVVSHFAFGKASLWAGVNGTRGELLPRREQEDATVDTIYDMASLTKMFTTVAVLRCLDRGQLDLNATVASYLPAFASHGKGAVTLLQLLTHTSGLQADPVPGLLDPSYPTYQAKVDAILGQALQSAPGTKYVYSDLNFMTLMLVVEEVGGKKLDEAIRDGITAPLGMRHTFFNRGNVEGPRFPFYRAMAPQEFQIAVEGDGPTIPKRPQPVRGTVHDENAYALGGVSGHAGLFSTAADTAVFCQMILNNGTYGGRRVLSQRAVDLIFTSLIGGLGEDHGVGFELNQYYTAGPMANMLAASHTGFTGTSLVIDRASNTLFVHLANRVHPSRGWASNNIVRETLGAWVATALGRDVEFPL
ncbi:beta-lactamase [Purpureocillium lavendulum]|uniref:Beta-lactamase n=1 Tax=Purpureocillium lavendulum TaxID=1247861 RepID=A0AB34FKG0_9HYPO|nr:beta-lactamase [Purpureocillium lavendulum]